MARDRLEKDTDYVCCERFTGRAIQGVLRLSDDRIEVRLVSFDDFFFIDRDTEHLPLRLEDNSYATMHSAPFLVGREAALREQRRPITRPSPRVRSYTARTNGNPTIPSGMSPLSCRARRRFSATTRRSRSWSPIHLGARSTLTLSRSSSPD